MSFVSFVVNAYPGVAIFPLSPLTYGHGDNLFPSPCFQGAGQGEGKAIACTPCFSITDCSTS